MTDPLLSKLTDSKLLIDNIVFALCKENEQRELYELFLEIIKEGDSYPQILPYSFTDFLSYFFPNNSKVLICKKDNEIIGGFYLKPNFPGRASHLANCGYIVKKEYRGKGLGFHLGKYSIDMAKELGYKSMIFNLVFSENSSSIKLWKKFGFKIIGTIPDAVRKNGEAFQDAYIMYKQLPDLNPNL